MKAIYAFVTGFCYCRNSYNVMFLSVPSLLFGTEISKKYSKAHLFF